MRGPSGTNLILAALLSAGLLGACGDGDRVAVPGQAGAFKSAAHVRAERRAFDGAPPMIPHENFGMTCTSCHNERGVAVPDVGFAPPMPHEPTRGISAVSNCRQCHLFRKAEGVFRENSFRGIQQDLRRGRRLFEGAPPVIPHQVFMRENCLACHTGKAAREEIRTDHPERTNCRQCHVERVTSNEFTR